MTVFFPLDTIRSRLQVEEHRKSKGTLTMLKELINEEGMYEMSCLMTKNHNYSNLTIYL